MCFYCVFAIVIKKSAIFIAFWQLCAMPDSTPPGLLADLLMQTLQAPRTFVERAFSEPDVAARARLALQAAEEHPDLDDEDDPFEATDPE